MITEKTKKYCCGCSACVNVCPKKCIKLINDENGNLFPSLEKELCVSCGCCKNVCPLENHIHLQTTPSEVDSKKCYYCRTTDDFLRESSSSGGVFPILARVIIEMGGVVYAACFNENFSSVHHVCIDKITDISKACGAKYIQSELNHCFLSIKEQLERNIAVLFVGTPCQIIGLNHFLGRSYDLLYTVDMICHGVPGNGFWQKYLNFRNKKNKPIKSISFRDKRNGWLHYGISIVYQDGSSYYSEHNRDPYMLAYLNNYSLSETCFGCQFRGLNRHCDITIGDAWGVNFVAPELFDDLGMSVVISHTDKGESLLKQANDRLITHEICYENIKEYNISTDFPANRPEDYEEFKNDVKSMTMNSLVKKYFYISPKTKIKDIIKRMLKNS